MTKKNSITTTQLCVILLGVLIAMRPILENALQAKFVENDCIITCIVAGAINLCLAILVCFAIKLNPGKSFFEIMSNFFGKVTTKIIMLLLCVVFVFKMLLIDYQINFLLYDAIYTDIDWYLFSIPVFIVMCYISIKGIRAIARVYSIFLPLALFVFVLTLFIAYFNATFDNILPLFSHSNGEFNKALCYLLIQSCEYIFLFTFMENVVITGKKYFSKIIPVLLAVFVLVVAFYVLFVAVLGKLAPYVQETLIKITQFKDNSFGYFKIDIFTTFFWIPLIILQNSFCLYGISYCLNKVFSIKKSISSVVVVCLLFATKFIPQINNQAIIDLFYKKIGVFVVGFVLLLPVLLLIASLKKERQNENWLYKKT